MNMTPFPYLSAAVRDRMLKSVLTTLPLTELSPDELQTVRAAVVEELEVLDPRDAVQATLAAQAVAFSQATMRALRRAREAAAEDGPVDRLEAAAMALSRSASRQMKALELRQQAASRPLRPAEATPAAAPEAAEPVVPAAAGPVPLPVPMPGPLPAGRAAFGVGSNGAEPAGVAYPGPSAVGLPPQSAILAGSAAPRYAAAGCKADLLASAAALPLQQAAE